MDLEYILGKMGAVMKVVLKMIREMVKELCNMLMVINMLEIGKTM